MKRHPFLGSVEGFKQLGGNILARRLQVHNCLQSHELRKIGHLRCTECYVKRKVEDWDIQRAQKSVFRFYLLLDLLLLILELFQILNLLANQLDIGESATLHFFVFVVTQKSIDVGDVSLPGFDSRKLHYPLNLVEAHLYATICRLQIFSVLCGDLVEFFDREIVRAHSCFVEVDLGLVGCVLMLTY